MSRFPNSTLLLALFAISVCLLLCSLPVLATSPSSSSFKEAATMSDEMVLFVTSCVSHIPRVASRFTSMFVSTLPPAVQLHGRHFLSGAASLVCAGWAVSPTPSFVPTDPFSDSVGVFVFGLGAIWAEWGLLRLLSTAPHTPRVVSHLEWALLVCCIAVPNGVVELGLLVTLAQRYTPETYTPAMVMGRLLRPFVGWEMRRRDFVLFLGGENGGLLGRWRVSTPKEATRWVESAMWMATLTAVGMLLVRLYTKGKEVEEEVEVEVWEDLDRVREEMNA